MGVMETHECVPTSTKTCSVCQSVKSQTEFYGKQAQCKDCYNVKRKAYYEANKAKVLERCAKRRSEKQDQIREYMARYYVENRQRILEKCAEYRNREDVRERELQRQRMYYAARAVEIQLKRKQQLIHDEGMRQRRKDLYRRHYQANFERYTEKTARRRRHLDKATPQWANLDAIRQIYKESSRISQETGIRHHVDHIIPIKGKNVCGLHVESNLQIIPALDNHEKFNKF
jgi:hypothetical protein